MARTPYVCLYYVFARPIVRLYIAPLVFFSQSQRSASTCVGGVLRQVSIIRLFFSAVWSRPGAVVTGLNTAICWWVGLPQNLGRTMIRLQCFV